MSANLTIPRWTIAGIPNWDELYVAAQDGSRELNLVSCTLINYTMVIGVSEVTDDTVDDVTCRVLLLEAIAGSVLRKDKKAVFITRGDVVRHVGLRTEAEPLSVGDFWARMRTLTRRQGSVGPSDVNEGSTALSSLYGIPS